MCKTKTRWIHTTPRQSIALSSPEWRAQRHVSRLSGVLLQAPLLRTLLLTSVGLACRRRVRRDVGEDVGGRVAPTGLGRLLPTPGSEVPQAVSFLGPTRL